VSLTINSAASLEGTGKLGWLYGYGEYLDYKAIIAARSTVANKDTRTQLPVRELTLKGFVLDDTSFRMHFRNLCVLNLEGCYDAGLAFNEDMKERITVSAPAVPALGDEFGDRHAPEIKTTAEVKRTTDVEVEDAEIEETRARMEMLTVEASSPATSSTAWSEAEDETEGSDKVSER